MSKAWNAGLLLAVVAVTACSENTISPSASTNGDDRVFVHGGGASQALTPTSKFKFQMTIDPRTNTTWDLGEGNSLRFPQGSLCDPTRSSYGASEWNKPCTASKYPVTLDVTVWVDANGHPRVNFEPSVRFVPSSDSRDWVVLTFADLEASRDPWFNINYCPTATSSCYNEALTDPSLATLRDPRTGRITRRLKHFSGYNVAAGREDESSLSIGMGASGSIMPGFASMSLSTSDLRLNNVAMVRSAYPGTSEEDAETILLRIRAGQKLSGYILASGRDEQ